MANKHGLKGSIVKKQAASRKMAKHKKQTFAVDIGNENRETRYKTSYKKRIRYYTNKKNFPPKTLPTKEPKILIEMGIIDERGFFLKGKKKNFFTKSMVDSKGLDFWGLPRVK